MAEFNLRKAILQYRNPDIFLDELSVVDTSVQEGDPQVNDAKTGNIQKKYFGMAEPLIRINSVIVKGLSYFNLDLTGFKPVAMFRFQTIDERFMFTSFPKDGDIFSVYIRAFGEMFKPIRMDFIITEVISPFSRSSSPLNEENNFEPSTGKFQTYTITGEVRIPKLYKNVSKVFKGNSSDALIKISEDLGLGYASNEPKTNDSMNWVCPNLDYETLIKNIVGSSWLGEEDYFDCWIDQYYNINLINLKKQFDEQNSQIETIRMAYGADYNTDLAPGADTKEIEFPILLTNATNYSKSPLFVTALSLEQHAGQINNDLGYFQRLQFYDDKLKSDKPKNKFVSYNIEAVTNKDLGARDAINKGRLGESLYKDEIKSTYIGTMYFENVHENYHQAQVQNIVNKNDSYKILLKVKNRAWTPFLYRGQTFPVNIMTEGSSTVSGDSKYTAARGDGTSLAPPPDKRTPNAFLSGNYVVLGFSIEYNKKDGMHQTMVLGKKQWTLNPGLSSDPSTLDPKNDPADFNDLVENASSQLQNDIGNIKSDIFGK
jgi:hypothetical protein